MSSRVKTHRRETSCFNGDGALVRIVRNSCYFTYFLALSGPRMSSSTPVQQRLQNELTRFQRLSVHNKAQVLLTLPFRLCLAFVPPLVLLPFFLLLLFPLLPNSWILVINIYTLYKNIKVLEYSPNFDDWRVLFTTFPSDSPLALDLAKLRPLGVVLPFSFSFSYSSFSTSVASFTSISFPFGHLSGETCGEALFSFSAHYDRIPFISLHWRLVSCSLI